MGKYSIRKFWLNVEETMRYSQKMLYVWEQLKILEVAIVSHSHEKYIETFGGNDSVSICKPDATKALIY